MPVVDPLRGLPFLGDEVLALPHDAVRTAHELQPLGEEGYVIKGHGFARAESPLPSPPHGENDQEEAQEPQAEGNGDELGHQTLMRTNARAATRRAAARSQQPSLTAHRDQPSKAAVRAWNLSPRFMAAQF